MRDSWNQACWSEVWFITRSEITRMPLAWAAAIEIGEVVDGADIGVDGVEVADVVATISQR